MAPQREVATAADRRSGGGTTDAVQVAELLVGLSRLDTLLGDLYLARAAERLEPVMGEGELRLARRDRADVEVLPEQLQVAAAEEDWARVAGVSGRLAAARRGLDGSRRALAVAEQLREPVGPVIDPLSPGLRGLAGSAAAEPEALRGSALAILERLGRLDPGAGDLYQARHAALSGGSGAERAGAPRRPAPAGGLKVEALAALKRGDLDALQALSTRLASEAGGGAPAGQARALEEHRLPPPPLTHRFSDEVLARAERLGLSAVHLPSAHERVADLYPLAWRPTPPLAETGEVSREEPLRLPVHFPPDVPLPLRELLTLYMRLPFVSSAGTRDLPSLVEEDALAELFDDPAPGTAPPAPLLDALRLPRRLGLSRVRIERALAAHGVGVVAGLGLDPSAFRLVCIPCDLHVRVGRERGWGGQPVWTHLDGHMVTPDRRLLALAGGDVRFGGVYDLVGIGRDYDAERLVVRFAVVLRRRQAVW